MWWKLPHFYSIEPNKNQKKTYLSAWLGDYLKQKFVIVWWFSHYALFTNKLTLKSIDQKSCNYRKCRGQFSLVSVKTLSMHLARLFRKLYVLWEMKINLLEGGAKKKKFSTQILFNLQVFSRFPCEWKSGLERWLHKIFMAFWPRYSFAIAVLQVTNNWGHICYWLGIWPLGGAAPRLASWDLTLRSRFQYIL